MFRSSLFLLVPGVLLATTLSAQHTTPQQSELIQVPGSDVQVRRRTVDGAQQSAVSRNGGRTWIEQYAPRNVISMRSRP